MSLVVDASVFVAAFHTTETQYRISEEFLWQAVAAKELICCPSLVLVESAATIVRLTGNHTAARRVADLMRHRYRVEFTSLDNRLADRAVELAIQCRTRGADSCYIALAKQAGATLVTWDREMLERGAAVVTTMTPEEWLHKYG